MQHNRPSKTSLNLANMIRVVKSSALKLAPAMKNATINIIHMHKPKSAVETPMILSKLMKPKPAGQPAAVAPSVVAATVGRAQQEQLLPRREGTSSLLRVAFDILIPGASC